MYRYAPSDYARHIDARRLFWIGKVTPVTACGALVVLAYCTRILWTMICAAIFFAIIAYGVATRVRTFLEEAKR